MDKANKLNFFKKGYGDRHDGWRVRKGDPIAAVTPFILARRTESEVFFDEKVELNNLEIFIKNNKELIPDLSIMHMIIAGMVRAISQRPRVNRFIIHNKMFARNNISFSIAIKRNLTDEGEETLIKPYYLPTDTLQDIVRKTNSEIEKNMQSDSDNSSDEISKVMSFLPDFLLRFVVKAIMKLDNIGLLPEALTHASPFHTSIFLTNSGSIGIEPIYHHLYEVGNCSMFISIGKKNRDITTQKDGTTKVDKSLTLRMVLDERICDGFYYASSIRLFHKILAHPEQLLLPPDKVVADECVGKKRLD